MSPLLFVYGCYTIETRIGEIVVYLLSNADRSEQILYMRCIHLIYIGGGAKAQAKIFFFNIELFTIMVINVKP